MAAAEVYPASQTGAEFWPPRFLCRPCDAHVGTHADTDPPEPLGSLADAELRGLRFTCHGIVDPLWKGMTLAKRRRKAVYKVLSHLMGTPEDGTHIGEWREDECRRFLSQVEKFYCQANERGLLIK